MANKRISQMPLISTINDSDELTVLRESDPNPIANKKTTYASLKAPLAVLRLPNVFQDVQTIPGLRVGTDVIITNHNVQVTDFELLVDATAGQVSINLPMALGTGQMLRVKKLDVSPNLVVINPQSGDLIDNDPSETLAHQFDGITLIDAALGQWDNATSISAFLLPPNVALRDQNNVFTRLNTFTGVQFATTTQTSNYALTTLDYEVLVDASAGPVIISLPAAIGSGQQYHVKKIDTSTNIVTLAAAGSDLIDDSISVNLDTQWADVEVLDADVGYWDNLGGSESVLPGNIAYVDFPNVFTDVNTFVGLRVGSRIVSSDYALTVTDYDLLVDASGGQVNVALPQALATGQVYRVKKIDPSANPVVLIPFAGDTINASVSVTLSNQFDGIIVIDAQNGEWDNATYVSPYSLPPNVALRDQANIFLQLNTFTGLRLSTRTVTADYTLTTLDFEVLVDATAGPVIITLPASAGNGQYYRVKKIDTTGNIVTVAAVGSDLIDGSISLNFDVQYADATLLDASPGYWDNTGSASGGGGGADFGINGRVVDLDPIRGFAFEVFDGATWIEQVRYTEPSSSPPPTTTVSYFYQPDITDLAGLKAWPTVGNLLNSRMDCLYGAGSNVSDSFSIYLLRSGAAAGGDPGQVAPDDYNVSTNDVHWEQKQ